MVYQNKKPLKNSLALKKIVILVLLLLALLLASLTVFWRLNRTERNLSQENTQTTSTAPTAQEGFNEGEEREPGNSLNESEGAGIITDNNGVVGSNTDTSNPSTSSSGEISVYSPKKDTSIKSGYEVSGSSTLPVVSYRIIDSVSGVIASGELQVVNGTFSGKLGFSTSAKEGRLDIFATRENGTEYSNIEIPLRFQP